MQYARNYHCLVRGFPYLSKLQNLSEKALDHLLLFQRQKNSIPGLSLEAADKVKRH